MARKPPLVELSRSFGLEPDAIRFGNYLKRKLGVESISIGCLTTPDGHATEWYRLAIPPKYLKRAEELRDAWDEGRRAALDQHYGRPIVE